MNTSVVVTRKLTHNECTEKSKQQNNEDVRHNNTTDNGKHDFRKSTHAPNTISVYFLLTMKLSLRQDSEHFAI